MDDESTKQNLPIEQIGEEGDKQIHQELNNGVNDLEESIISDQNRNETEYVYDTEISSPTSKYRTNNIEEHSIVKEDEQNETVKLENERNEIVKSEDEHNEIVKSEDEIVKSEDEIVKLEDEQNEIVKSEDEIVKLEDEQNEVVKSEDEHNETVNSEDKPLNSEEVNEETQEYSNTSENDHSNTTRVDILKKAGVILQDDKEEKVEGLDEEDGDEDITIEVVPENGENSDGKRVHFSEDVVRIPTTGTVSSPQLPGNQPTAYPEIPPNSPTSPMRNSLPGIPQISREQLVTGVLYQAQYLSSTPIMFTANQRTVRMQQARDAVLLIKDPENETQPRIDVDLKISTKSLIIADRKTKTDLIVHPLKTVSYVADIERSLVIMAHRNPPSSPGTPIKLNCHVLDTADPREVAMVIGQAFSTAYKEFLKSHGIKEDSLDQFEYQHVLSSQHKSDLEINSLADENKTKEISFAKHKGEILGLMVIDSGYGSAIPSCVVAHMNKTGAVAKSSLINVGDHILSINGISLVGMPLKLAVEQIKKCRSLTVVKMITSCCPAVIDVTIMRPDLKFQLGFSVKDGNICSLWRGSIAERSGIRVGHRIIEINGTSVVGLTHEEIVHMLSTTVGDIHIRTMPIVMYQILTGQIIPEYS